MGPVQEHRHTGGQHVACTTMQWDALLFAAAVDVVMLSSLSTPCPCLQTFTLQNCLPNRVCSAKLPVQQQVQWLSRHFACSKDTVLQGAGAGAAAKAVLYLPSEPLEVPALLKALGHSQRNVLDASGALVLLQTLATDSVMCLVVQVAGAVGEDSLYLLFQEVEKGLEEAPRRPAAAGLLAHFCSTSKLDFQQHVPSLLTVSVVVICQAVRGSCPSAIVVCWEDPLGDMHCSCSKPDFQPHYPSLLTARALVTHPPHEGFAGFSTSCLLTQCSFDTHCCSCTAGCPASCPLTPYGHCTCHTASSQRVTKFKTCWQVWLLIRFASAAQISSTKPP